LACAVHPPRPTIEACSSLDKDTRDRKLGGNLRDAINHALETSRASVQDDFGEAQCPAALEIDIAGDADGHLPNPPGQLTSERAGRRQYYYGIRPSHGLPASADLLGFVCKAATLAAVEKIELYHGIPSDPMPEYTVSAPASHANDQWMGEIHDAYLGDIPSSKTVAIIDTGIIPEHEDLPPIQRFRVVESLNENGSCGSNGCCTPVKDKSTNEWHATAVAGTIAAKREPQNVGIDGLSMPARLIAIDVSEGVPNCTVLPKIAVAMQCALQHCADAINFSMGGDTGDLPSSLQSVLDMAADRNVLVVSAAGNTSNDLDTKPFWPAAYKTSTSITAITGGTKTGSWGHKAYGSKTVDLAVPVRNANVQSTSNKGHYINYGMTSAAAAIVTGTAISLWSRPEYSNCSAAQIKQILMNETLPLPPPFQWLISPLGGVLDFGFIAEQSVPPPDMCTPPLINAPPSLSLSQAK